VLQRKLAPGMGELETSLGELLERLDAVPHAAIVHGPGLADGTGGQRRVLALHELVRELSLGRHVVTLALPAAAGTTGARDVLTWQTGYSEDIDLASGHPDPVTATTPLDTDVSLCIEGGRDDPPGEAIGIALGCLPIEGAELWIRTAAAGVEAAGTAHRLDGVPLTLQAPVPADAPTAAALLARLLAEIGP
jgi:formylmethanofuran dehydrogenase subunit B